MKPQCVQFWRSRLSEKPLSPHTPRVTRPGVLGQIRMRFSPQVAEAEPVLAKGRGTAYLRSMRASFILLFAALPLALHGQSQGQQGQNGNGAIYALPRVAVAP